MGLLELARRALGALLLVGYGLGVATPCPAYAFAGPPAPSAVETHGSKSFWNHDPAPDPDPPRGERLVPPCACGCGEGPKALAGVVGVDFALLPEVEAPPPRARRAAYDDEPALRFQTTPRASDHVPRPAV